MSRPILISATVIAPLCGCGGTAAATTARSAARPAAAVTRSSHGYSLVGPALAIREPHSNGTVSFQVRFRLNKTPPADPAGGPKLHVDLSGEGPETAPSRVGVKARRCYASEIANDAKTISADAKTLPLAVRVGATAAHITIGQSVRVVPLGKSFANAYSALGCKA